MRRIGRAVVFLAAGTLACEAEIVAPVAVSRVTVEPSEARLSLGDDMAFSVTVLDELERALAGAIVTWSSDDLNVVSVGADGAAMAVGPGTTRVRALIDGVSGSAVVRVQAAVLCKYGGNGRGKGKKDRDDERKGKKGKKGNHDEHDDDPDCAPSAEGVRAVTGPIGGGD